MKLYYSPLACSLADHIALQESGADFLIERVDLANKITETGRNYDEITPKGYVPALQFANGEVLTENIAILDWISSSFPVLAVPGELGRARSLEALSFISSELHPAFRPMWNAGAPEEILAAAQTITRLLGTLANRLTSTYLFGEHPGVADFYLFVMLLWAERLEITTPKDLVAMRERMKARPAVQAAMRAEGLI